MKIEKIGKMIVFILAISLVLTGCSSSNDTITGQATSGLDASSEKVTVYFFWGDGCPHCTNQKPFMEELARDYPEIEIKSYETWKERDNVKIFQDVAAAHGVQARGVPATFIGDKNWVGYNDRMKPEMKAQIEKCLNEGCNDPVKE